MPESIACPHCGAPLDVKDDRAATIRCRFCGQSIRLSVGATSPAIQATVIRLAPRRAGTGWVLMASEIRPSDGGRARPGGRRRRPADPRQRSNDQR